MGAEMFHADRQTDTKKLIVAFRNFRTHLKTTIRFSVLNHAQPYIGHHITLKGRCSGIPRAVCTAFFCHVGLVGVYTFSLHSIYKKRDNISGTEAISMLR